MATKLGELLPKLTEMIKMNDCEKQADSPMKSEQNGNDGKESNDRAEREGRSKEPECSRCNAPDFPFRLAYVKNGREFYIKCECAIRREYERICRNAGFDLAESKTIADYQGWCETAKKARMKAEDYIQNFDTIRNQEQNWLFVCGQSGAGKTMLGRAIVKALIERESLVRARAVKYYEMMQILKANSNAEGYGDILDRYTDCELLFVDDLLKEKAKYGEMTEADIKHLFAVIDSRYEAGRPTIITTECTGDRLEELNEAIYWRIVERAYAEIIFEGTESNYRKRA